MGAAVARSELGKHLQSNRGGQEDANQLTADTLPAARTSINERLRSRAQASEPTSDSVTTETNPRNEAVYEAMVKACRDPKWLEEHGRAYSILKSTEDFMSLPFQEVHAIPDPAYVASNFKPGLESEELYFVNGMLTTPENLEGHLNKLVKMSGRPVTAIINGQEEEIPFSRQPGIFRSGLHGLLGLISAEAGSAVESEAVGRIEQVILRHLRTGQKLHLIAHSQGSIITRNALDRVLGEQSSLTAEEKDKVKALVSVSTFGAAEHYFPLGVKVQEYAHRNDAISMATSLFTDIREGVKSVFSWAKRTIGGLFSGSKSAATSSDLEVARAPREYLDGDHDLGPFISEFPKFFIEKYSKQGQPPGASVAAALSNSVATAQLSDVVHARIIQEMLHRHDGDFARTLLELHPDGMIGAFRIPFNRTLKGLAAREVRQN